MKPEQDPIEDWLKARRNEPAPSLPDHFAEQISRRLSIAQNIISASPRIWMLRIAALIVVGAVGFVRMELFTLLMIAGA